MLYCYSGLWTRRFEHFCRDIGKECRQALGRLYIVGARFEAGRDDAFDGWTIRYRKPSESENVRVLDVIRPERHPYVPINVVRCWELEQWADDYVKSER